MASFALLSTKDCIQFLCVSLVLLLLVGVEEIEPS